MKNSRTILFLVLATAVALVVAIPFQAIAQRSSQNEFDRKFLGKALSPSAGTYLTLRDVNVRRAPLTKSARVSRFRKGVRIRAAGKAKGTAWVAVRRDGKDLGFIYGTVLAAVLDGKLDTAISGKLNNTGQPSCSYTIKFDTKSKVNGHLQVTSDYQITLACNIDKRRVKFVANMFITELPYRDIRDEIYQVNVDLPRVAGEGGEVMSVTCLYHYYKNQLVFEALTNPNMARKVTGLKKKVKSIPEVLIAALEFSYRLWGPAVWRIIVGGNRD